MTSLIWRALQDAAPNFVFKSDVGTAQTLIARPSDRIPERIDGLDVGKVLFVVGDDDAVVGLGNRSDDSVESAARPKPYPS
jgi:hypothetical protein